MMWVFFTAKHSLLAGHMSNLWPEVYVGVAEIPQVWVGLVPLPH